MAVVDDDVEVGEGGEQLVVVVANPVASRELLIPRDVVEVGVLAPGAHDLVEVALDLGLHVLVDELDAFLGRVRIDAHG